MTAKIISFLKSIPENKWKVAVDVQAHQDTLVLEPLSFRFIYSDACPTQVDKTNDDLWHMTPEKMQLFYTLSSQQLIHFLQHGQASSSRDSNWSIVSFASAESVMWFSPGDCVATIAGDDISVLVQNKIGFMNAGSLPTVLLEHDVDVKYL